MMLKNNPWKSLNPAKINSIRVNADSPYNLFYSVGPDGKYMLDIHYSIKYNWVGKEPSLMGIQVHSGTGVEYNYLILELNDSSNYPIFLDLCNDIFKYIASSKSEIEMLDVLYKRLMVWQKFFTKNNNSTLSIQQQIGLIGELLFLRDIIFPNINPQVGVKLWIGPLGGKQDFTNNFSVFEIKTTTKTNEEIVNISSVEQLETLCPHLLLIVFNINKSLNSQKDTFTLNSLVDDIKYSISEAECIACYEHLLIQAGYINRNEYSQHHYCLINRSQYYVREGFPRVRTSQVPFGILNVKYELDLTKCTDYKIDHQELVNFLLNLKE